MMGRMGVDTVTTQNLLVHAIDIEKNLILILQAPSQCDENSTALLISLLQRRRLGSRGLLRIKRAGISCGIDY
jgi:hypothetical protein